MRCPFTVEIFRLFGPPEAEKPEYLDSERRVFGMAGPRKRFSLLVVASTLIIGVVLGVWQTMAPGVDDGASARNVAFERMLANLAQMAPEPHPVGSAPHEAVRARILAEITDMGLTPSVEHSQYTLDEMIAKLLRDGGVATMDEFWEQYHWLVAQYYDVHSLDEFFDEYLGGMFDEDGVLPLQNIVVRLDAPGTDRGVLFVAHYDSTPDGPGAADDMLGVVSILEAMRSQVGNGALKSDLYFLLSDGEERGLLGAERFVEAHPELRNKIDLVVNLDALGNRGPLMLYQTSANAYRLVDAVRASGAWLYGYSVGAKVFSVLPNDTDLTPFLDAGYRGLNFAAIEGSKVNHTMDDVAESLNRATAWHYLGTALSLVDYAANNSLEDLGKPSREAVFFPFLPGGMVLMTDVVSHILCAIACALALAWGLVRLRAKELRPGAGVGMGLLLVASVAGSVFFVAGAYLFYVPLLFVALAGFVKKWRVVHTAAGMVAGVVTLMLWVPAFIVTWWTMVVPMLL